MAALTIDLTPALRDAYLRKIALGPGGEPLEAAFHVLRRVLSPREREADRLYGLRFRGVRGAAVESVRWDRDEADWVEARVDWLHALSRREMEPPIIATATVGGDETVERWAKAAERALWVAGTPGAVATGEIPAAPVLFEATGEAILPNGWNANVRLFVAADALEVAGSRGPIAAEALVRAGEEWTAKWRDYWRRKEWKPELDDPQFEWNVPTPDDAG